MMESREVRMHLYAVSLHVLHELFFTRIVTPPLNAWKQTTCARSLHTPQNFSLWKSQIVGINEPTPMQHVNFSQDLGCSGVNNLLAVLSYTVLIPVSHTFLLLSIHKRKFNSHPRIPVPTTVFASTSLLSILNNALHSLVYSPKHSFSPFDFQLSLDINSHLLTMSRN